MVTIIFEVHATTLDNENHISSGYYDAELSDHGVKQCKELGERYAQDQFDAIFCSDLQRSYKTAELAFGNKFPIIKDARLRECDYGDLTRHPASEVEAERAKRIHTPFPNGESYEQAVKRVQAFLADLLRDYDGKRVMTIGHGATWRALEHLLMGAPLEKAITIEHKWQPGWRYILNATP